MVSGFRIKIYSPLLARIPTLFPLENLRFSPFSMTSTRGNASRIRSGEPSVDPLSDTITSNSVECTPEKMELRQLLITLKSFQQRITIDNFTIDPRPFVWIPHNMERRQVALPCRS